MHNNNNKLARSNQGNAVGQLMQRNAELSGLGFEIFGDQEFVRYPVIGVNQPTSDYKPEGKFHNRATGNVYDQIEVVFLGMRRSMSFRPHGYNDPMPTCFSSNALRPDSTVEQPIHHICHRMGPRGLIAECPHAQWNRNGEGKARRECDLKYTAAVDYQGEQFLMYFQGRSIAPLEKFISQLRQMRQPLFGVRSTLTLTYRTKKEGFMGNFYEINFPDLSNPSERDRMEVVDALAFQEAAQFFKDYFDSAPSDLYHESEETDKKDEVPLGEGITYASASPQPNAGGRGNINNQWGNDADF